MKSLGFQLVRSIALLSVAAIFFFSSAGNATGKGISFQAVLKKPDGTYPSVSGINVTLQILSPISECVLREEVHSGVNIANGYLNLVLGSAAAATPAGRNPVVILTLPQVFDNSTAKSGLNCVDNNDVIVTTGQTYTPAASHTRKLRLRLMIGSDIITADFNLRAVAYAINSDNLDGKSASDFVQISPAITQTNVQSIFSRYSTLDSILNGTFAGNAATATALAAAPGACPAGQYMNAMTASGSITCGAPTGSVTSVTSANSYLSVATGTSTPVLTLNVGTAANTVAAGDDSRFTDSRPPNGTAGGDLSGSYPNPAVAKIAGTGVVITTPANGDVLKYNGTNFVNASGADTTKLPLAGGTMTGAIDMNTQNMTNLGFITMSANKNLHLSNNTADPSGLVAADKGKIWFNSTSGEVKYWDGSAAQTFGVAGSGLQTFNTQTGTSQSLAIGTSGTTPAWNSATNTHTLNIPMASTASVTAGLLSKTDYDAFNAKLGAATSFTGDVSGTYNSTSVDKIKGKAIAATTYAAGQTLRYDGTDWINSVLNFADLGTKPTTLAGYGITDAQSSTLADGKILVGNGSNVATAVTMSGDATLSNAGALTLATVPLTKGGTGVTSFTGDRIITTSAAGALQASTCSINQVISFSVTGAVVCADVSSIYSGFANGGNTFAANATIGTNDAYALNFETNNSARMTILSDGKVGIGVTAPAGKLHVEDSIPAGTVDLQVKNQSNTGTSKFIMYNDSSSWIGMEVYGSLHANVDARNAANLTTGGGLSLITNSGLQNGGTGSMSFLTGGWDTSTQTRMTIDSTGKVGIGESAPSASLDVKGAIKTSAVSNAGTSIDFSTGNLQYTSESCGAITLNNMKSGATYTLAVQGAAGGTCVFTVYSGNGSGALTFKAGPISMVQTAGKDALFTFLVMGTTVYAAAIDGY